MAEEKQGNNPNVIFRIPLAFLITVVDYEGIKEDLLCENVENVMNKNGLANGVDYKQFGKTIDDKSPLAYMLKNFDGDELKKKTVSAIENVIHWKLNSSDPDEKKEDELSGDEQSIVIEIKNGYNVDLCKADCLKTVKHFTKKNGAIYALLNMANKEFIGGHYESGFIAQEETIWNRTSCHFSVKHSYNDVDGTLLSDRKQDEPNKYTDELSQLINCNHSTKLDEVYLDMNWPRTCILKSDKTELSPENYFPFWELRSAAQQLGDDKYYTDNEHQITYKKINAQFNTLKKNGVKHVVLGAFGCGKFNNYAPAVAQIYRNLIIKYHKYFDHIAFAILPEKNKENEAIFKKVLEGIKFVLPKPLSQDLNILKKNYIKFLFIELMNTASQYYDNTNYDKKNYVKYYRDIYETSLVGGNYFDKYVHNKKNYENITKLFYYEMYKTNKLLYEKLY
jgi:hypothetical protein